MDRTVIFNLAMALVGKYPPITSGSSKYVFLEHLLRSSKKYMDPSPKFDFLVASEANCLDRKVSLDRKVRSIAVFFPESKALRALLNSPYFDSISFACPGIKSHVSLGIL